jgi:taurine dioxygenase/sulfonate dioxygenase
MAPSIAENPTAEVVVPVKVNPQASTSKPKVRRIIEEEGGKSTASVRNTLNTL